MSDPVRAAGILFLTPQKKALFLLRGNGGDFPNHWCFPGGHVEGEESLEECARRESKEELGSFPSGNVIELSRQITSIGDTQLNPQPVSPLIGVSEAEGQAHGPVEVPPAPLTDFTTYLMRVDEEFVPTLSGEHIGYAWAPTTQPPQIMHPGCGIALERLTMDELGISRAIADGRLASPQHYENVWLFDIRITGTGLAYRHSSDEFAWREPALYCNPEFIARCNGLPVIWKHPKGAILNSKEFDNRIVGTIMLPYIKGEEVWGIAKIFDEDAVKEMREKQLSTSPSVMFRDPSVNRKLKDEDGDTILIEGKPSLLDHVAICEQGVWDKQGPPVGIVNDSNGESKLSEKEKETKDDAAGGNLDKLLSKMDAVCAKMDAMEAKDAARKDAEEKAEKEKADAKAKADAAKKDEDEKDKKEEGKPEDVAADKKKKDAADAAKKDADEKEKEKEKADAAKADAFADSVTKLMDRLAQVEAKLHKPLNDSDRKLYAAAQAQADSVYRAFGDEAPRWLQGEDLGTYRRRLAAKVKDHSPAWKPVDITAMADDAAFDVAEKQIYSDAAVAARNPQMFAADSMDLRMVPDVLPSGHKVNTFYGRPSGWMNRFAGNKTFVTAINDFKKGVA